MTILRVDRVLVLPKNDLTLCYWFFATTIVINIIRDLVGKEYVEFIHVPMTVTSNRKLWYY